MKVLSHGPAAGQQPSSETNTDRLQTKSGYGYGDVDSQWFDEVARKPSDHSQHYFDGTNASEWNWDRQYVVAMHSVDRGPLAGVTRIYGLGETPASDIPAYWKDIPAVLRERPNWIWLTEDDSSGCTVKKPYLGRARTEVDALKPINWIPFHSLERGVQIPSGWGYVLTDDTISDGGRLVCIEISKASGLGRRSVVCLWEALGCPYLEYSYESDGWVLLGTTRKFVPTFNDTGIQIRCSSGYVELCGLGAAGSLRDITEEIQSLHAYRYPRLFNGAPPQGTRPETRKNVAQLQEQLTFISADCSYDIYRRVVWAMLSTGWSCAQDMALTWSMTAPRRFQQRGFDGIVRSFDPARPNAPTLGSIYHLARKGGWHG